MKNLGQRLNRDAAVCVDVGQNQIWACRHLWLNGSRFLTSGGLGTMGYSLPAAVGVKVAQPERQTLVACGDGSFQMSMCELATAVQHGVPIKIVVINNHSLGMVLEHQDNCYSGHRFAVELGQLPNISALAAAYGIPAQRIDRGSQCEAAIERLLQAEGPALLECMISPEEVSP
jgi:acetolactate synthase-1/2/3 large subunit